MNQIYKAIESGPKCFLDKKMKVDDESSFLKLITIVTTRYNPSNKKTIRFGFDVKYVIVQFYDNNHNSQFDC